MAILCADPPDTRPLGEGGAPLSEEARRAAPAAGGGTGQLSDVGETDAEPFSLGTVRETSETEEAIFPAPAPPQEYQAEWYGYDGYGGPYWGAMQPQYHANSMEQKLWLAKAAFWAEMARLVREIAHRKSQGRDWWPAEWGGGDRRMYVYCKALDAFRDALSADDGSQPRDGCDTQRSHGGPCRAARAAVRDEDRTTVMLRNLPNDYTRRAVLDILDQKGFRGRYKFFYKPVDFSRCAGKGYCFVDFVDHDTADEAIEELMGFNSWACRSGKTLEPVWSEQEQGYDSLLDRYTNSPLNHPDVPDEYKPKIYVDGEERSLPLPAAFVRMPSLLAVARRNHAMNGTSERTPHASKDTVVEAMSGA